jgi:hypothetical protein
MESRTSWSCARRAAAALLAAGAFAATPAPSAAQFEVQNFDTNPPDWTGLRNTTGDGFGADYGFRMTDTAGGAPGEAGGTIPARTREITYYADTNLGGNDQVFTRQTPLTASGRITAASIVPGFDGGLDFGFFNSQTAAGNVDIIGMRLIDNDATSLRWEARGFAGGVEAPRDTKTLTVGQDLLFTMTYDPIAVDASTGRLTVTLNLAADNSLVGTSTTTFSNSVPVSLDAFGLVSLDLIDAGANSPGDFFIDDLTYTPEPTAALSLLALGGFAGLRGRRRRA